MYRHDHTGNVLLYRDRGIISHDRQGNDIAIVACGTMVHYALAASDILADKGIEATVIDMHTLKPLDEEILQMELSKKLIVTVEEATPLGGLGGAVAEYLAPL